MLLYWTAAVDNERRVVFKQDIYDRDGAVLAGHEMVNLNSEAAR